MEKWFNKTSGKDDVRKGSEDVDVPFSGPGVAKNVQ